MVVHTRKKALRDYTVSIEDAHKALHLSRSTFRKLVDEGFISSAARVGYFRLGSLLDGYAEAVRVGRIPGPSGRAGAGENADPVSEAA